MAIFLPAQFLRAPLLEGKSAISQALKERHAIDTKVKAQWALALVWVGAALYCLKKFRASGNSRSFRIAAACTATLMLYNLYAYRCNHHAKKSYDLASFKIVVEDIEALKNLSSFASQIQCLVIKQAKPGDGYKALFETLTQLEDIHLEGDAFEVEDFEFLTELPRYKQGGSEEEGLRVYHKGNEVDFGVPSSSEDDVSSEEDLFGEGNKDLFGLDFADSESASDESEFRFDTLIEGYLEATEGDVKEEELQKIIKEYGELFPEIEKAKTLGAALLILVKGKDTDVHYGIAYAFSNLKEKVFDINKHGQILLILAKACKEDKHAHTYDLIKKCMINLKDKLKAIKEAEKILQVLFSIAAANDSCRDGFIALVGDIQEKYKIKNKNQLLGDIVILKAKSHRLSKKPTLERLGIKFCLFNLEKIDYQNILIYLSSQAKNTKRYDHLDMAWVVVAIGLQEGFDLQDKNMSAVLLTLAKRKDKKIYEVLTRFLKKVGSKKASFIVNINKITSALSATNKETKK